MLKRIRFPLYIVFIIFTVVLYIMSFYKTDFPYIAYLGKAYLVLLIAVLLFEIYVITEKFKHVKTTGIRSRIVRFIIVFAYTFAANLAFQYLLFDKPTILIVISVSLGTAFGTAFLHSNETKPNHDKKNEV